MCLNNLSSCFFNEGFLDQADKFNDMALTEDPDYAKAHYRKCTILAEKGDIKRAIMVANSAIKTYSNEMETDYANVKVVPMFRAFIQENEDKEEMAEEAKQERIEKEVEQELEESMGPFFDLENELRKIEGEHPVSESDEDEDLENKNDAKEEKTVDAFITETSNI